MKTYEDYRQLTENALKAYFMRPAVPQQLLLDAMGYSVLAGGKRLRGVLVLAFCEACGGKRFKSFSTDQTLCPCVHYRRHKGHEDDERHAYHEP